MEPTILGLMVDSSILIDAERRGLDVSELLETIATVLGEAEPAVCSIPIAELAHGMHRAKSPELWHSRREFLDDLKASVPVYAVPARWNADTEC